MQNPAKIIGTHNTCPTRRYFSLKGRCTFMKIRQQRKKDRISEAVSGAISAYRDVGENTDVLGMYTGVSRLSDAAAPTNAVDGGKTYCKIDRYPVQDADDL